MSKINNISYEIKFKLYYIFFDICLNKVNNIENKIKFVYK